MVVAGFEVVECGVEGEVRVRDHLYMRYPADVEVPRAAEQVVHVKDWVVGWSWEG